MIDLDNLSTIAATAARASSLTRHQFPEQLLRLICFGISNLLHLPIMHHLQIWSQCVAVKVEPYLELVVAEYRFLLTEDGVCEVR